jgi:two-component system, NtrC family, sensor kinase
MRLALRFPTLFAGLLTGLLLYAGILNLQQRSRYQIPEDGVTWADSADGVKAWIVTIDGPGYRVGIREGDLLRAVNGVTIYRASDATREVFRSGVWSRLVYELVREGKKFRVTLVTVPQNRSNLVRHLLDLVGFLYLVIGAFILLRRWRSRYSLHFYLFCLASYVLYSFSYTGKLNGFDWVIYWLNVAATLLQPALFLHFCLRFPEQASFIRERRSAVPLVYLPGALLGLVHVMVASGVWVLPVSLLTARWVLDRIELTYLALYFLAGAACLQYSFNRTRVPLLKQQLKWVTRGTYVAVVPFALFYVLPYFLGFIPPTWMKFSALSLVFLPLTFGYAIVRYRLMDVDIIFSRGIAYTLATATIAGIYFGAVALLADFFHSWIPITGHGGWLLGIVVTALLFQPMVTWIQAHLDRFFNPAPYDYRKTLLEFARELTSELHVGRLLEEVIERLAETLNVDRAAIILGSTVADFRLVESRGLAYSGTPDFSFLDPLRPEMEKGYLFFDSVKRAFGVTKTAQATVEQLDLHYYLPFKVKERTLGYLALGKTHKGDFLSSQDVDLLKTITGYVSIALENARLYQSLEQKALQNQALKEFSESIVESINAGVLACNLDQEVEAWNSAMEQLYGLDRAQAVGRTLGEIFPPELMAELTAAPEAKQDFSLYKFRLRTVDGRQLIVNLSLTPLVGRDGDVIGRLLIVNDLTERVSLEDQLVQAEKLSSIGLLAAGVAHEVNTPLAVITSQAQMLMRQFPAEDTQAKTLDKIIKQAFRASEIVNNLLKFSRVSSSEYNDLDLNKVIHETLSLLEPMLRASKIVLSLQLTPDLAPVYGNAVRLQQVFMNLIVNARDAMPFGGELTLATEAEDSTVRVEVSDNGVGIPTDHLHKIFDPFFTTKSTSRGTGLGLAVSYGIIREHSAKVHVESQVGKGTTFRLEFPVARKPVHAL